MAVTCLRIIRITEGAMGACVMHLEDGSEIIKSPDWALQHKPQVHGYIIDNGKPDGENWYATSSASPLQAALIEVQRIEVKPGDVLLFRLPAGATFGQAAVLIHNLRAVAPDVPYLIVAQDGVEVVTVDGGPAAAAGAEVKA